MARIRDKWRRWISHRREQEPLAEALLDCFPGVVVLTDAHGVILRVNPGFEQHSGHSAKALVGRRITCLDVDPLHGDISHALAHCVARRRPWRGVLLCRRADGGLTHQDGDFQPLGADRGEPLRLLVTLHDITELRQKALHDHALLERLQGTLSRLPGAVFQLRQDARGGLDFLYLSDGLCSLSGLSSRSVMDRSDALLERVHVEDQSPLSTSLAQSAVSLEPWALEFRLETADGIRWLEGRASPSRRRDGTTLWDGMLLDITPRKQEEQRTQRLVSTDMLTGALNRRAFFDFGEAVRAHAARQGRSVPVAMLDIDHFKRLNDSHGHAVGDLALQAFAMTCRDSLRPYDLFARIGGEEFAIMLVDSSPEEAWGVLDRLRAAVEAIEIEVADTTLWITVSLGLAVLPPEGSLDLALSQADQALYRAKHEGRNRLAGSPDYSRIHEDARR
ncbi:diguanylate cyclase [Halomonas rhizosphaerae]|uniref:Diguanylate cyclase n=1 Tax=Halomonas rhizosphaerae TaxID=3043296 RepID=A0ABT6V1Q9_9GAMM|nr:diguanylate cyclase [Halomonas rhizosphaerae]MDI5891740.1 diguanylate cyclase [Halomonas rhizosphaerae]